MRKCRANLHAAVVALLLKGNLAFSLRFSMQLQFVSVLWVSGTCKAAKSRVDSYRLHDSASQALPSDPYLPCVKLHAVRSGMQLNGYSLNATILRLVLSSLPGHSTSDAPMHAEPPLSQSLDLFEDFWVSAGHLQHTVVYPKPLLSISHRE